MREATHGGDLLGGEIEFGGSVARISVKTNTVDLLVHFSAVVVSVLTGTWDGEADASWMPCTDTGDLAETLVSLAGELASAPSGSDTFEAMALGDTDDVNVLVLFKDRGHWNLLFKMCVSPVNLLGSRRATVDLNFHQMGLLLTNSGLADLSVCKDTDEGGVLLETLKLSVYFLTAIGLVFAGMAREGLALAAVPVLVEAASKIIA